MRKKIFTILLALAASVGMMNAKVTWNSSNVSDLNVSGTYASYSKEGVTLRANADMIDAWWQGYGDESHDGISFNVHVTGGFTFSNTLGKNFTKIEMFPNGHGGWDMANLGSGWSCYWDYEKDFTTVTWTGNAATVDLLKEASDFPGENVKSIVFYFEGDSEEPAPTYTIALQDGTANADKVTLSATSAVEGATITVTPNEEYEIKAFKATYNTTEELSTSFNAGTGAYSFTMPAFAVTIEATIALKPVPEGDIFAGFTATAGSGGFGGEGHANLVDNKYISSNWTKWCANDGHKSVPTGESGDACWWIDFEASAALNPTGYILTTGNDTGSEHGRNPKNWLLKAKLNADDAWTTIATVTNDVTMKNQSFKDYKFFVDQSGSYKYFRFEVFANQGAGVMQLCELRLIGTEASEPVLVTAYTLQLHVNDAAMGSVAVTNLLGSDIIDNGDGTFTVPEGAEVTLLATPNEGYEFTGWKASSTICDFAECEFVALKTVDNPLTFDMYAEAAFMAEFAAVAPAPATPDWVRDGDTWDDATKTLTVNSNTGDNAYASKTDIKHLIVSDAVTELGWGTFFFDSLMTTVELGNNLEIIGISAFNECRSLSTITVPASVTNIKVRAFRNCTSLTTFTCEAVTPPTIGNAIFENDNNLTAIYVPAASVDAYKTAWSDYASLIEAIGGGSTPTTWTALKVGDVIKVGDQLSPSVEWESANDYGVIKPDWAPYTLLRANIAQEHEWDDPVVTEAEDGAYYVFKFTHPTSGTCYLLANSAKSPLLAATATSDGLEVTNVGDDYGTPAFTFAVHENGSDPTAVENVQGNVRATKVIENGVLYIMYDGIMYNVQGTRVR